MIKSNRDLDGLVAERVMGWQPKTLEECGYEPWGIEDEDPENADPLGKCWYPPDVQDGIPFEVPSFSTEIRAAWDVVEKVTKKFYISVTSMEKGWQCVLCGDETQTYIDLLYSTAPLAICIAALVSTGMSESDIETVVTK